MEGEINNGEEEEKTGPTFSTRLMIPSLMAQ